MTEETTEKDEVKTVEEPEYEVGKVVYEQDLRAATHRNGWTSHLVGSSVDSPPPENPDDDDDDDNGGDKGKSPKSLRYLLAGTYLTAGFIALYVGITMIRDLRGEK